VQSTEPPFWTLFQFFCFGAHPGRHLLPEKQLVLNSPRSEKKEVHMRTILVGSIAFLCVSSLAVLRGAAGTKDTKQDLRKNLAALKHVVAEEEKVLLHYSWTQHNDISVRGEVKGAMDESVRHGPRGTLEKSPKSPPPPQKVKELTEYMERAVKLIERYVPLSPEKMETSYKAGNVSLSNAGPEKVRLNFKNYGLRGDTVSCVFDTSAKKLREVEVSSFLDKDIVTIEVEFQTLPDETHCVEGTVLRVAAKNIQVRTENIGYRKTGT
jgi:hypothetical protein